jgi:hypothetical protein
MECLARSPNVGAQPDPDGIVAVRAQGGIGVLVEHNWQWIRGEHGSITSAAMKGSAGAMELGTAVDEASRATGGGENSCVVSTPMQWKHFIWTGWLEAACRGMQ